MVILVETVKKAKKNVEYEEKFFRLENWTRVGSSSCLMAIYIIYYIKSYNTSPLLEEDYITTLPMKTQVTGLIVIRVKVLYSSLLNL